MMSEWAPIPGETPIDISDLKVKGISNRAQLSVVEAENIRKVIVKYLSKRPTRKMAPFDLSWFKRLHKQMFGDVWRWAGRIRREDLNIGVRWSLIETSLQELADDLAYWERDGTNVLERATRLHYRAVFIHPFQNGNGRWARMLANILLKRNDGSVTEWPDPELGDAASSIRGEYLTALQAADHGEIEPLMALHQRFTPMPARPVIARPVVSDLHPGVVASPPIWSTPPPPNEE